MGAKGLIPFLEGLNHLVVADQTISSLRFPSSVVSLKVSKPPLDGIESPPEMHDAPSEARDSLGRLLQLVRDYAGEVLDSDSWLFR